MRRMSRHLPDKNRTESTHADTPHLLPLRRMSEGLYRKGRENQAHAHSRLEATVHLKIRLSSHKATHGEPPKRHEAQHTTFRQQKTTGKEVELS